MKLFRIYSALISFVLWQKRLARKAELRRHIETLLQSCGCERARYCLEQIIHLHEYYWIPLPVLRGPDGKLTFDGTIDGVCVLAAQSFARHVESFRASIHDAWTLEASPDELCLAVPRAQGWDHPQSVQLYAQSLRKLKKLERRQRSFLNQARAFIGRAFSCLHLKVWYSKCHERQKRSRKTRRHRC